MALAILDWNGLDGDNVGFSIDTGTNLYYQLKAGRSVRRRNGIDWVDDVYFATRLGKNEASGDLLGSSKNIAVPSARFERGHTYVQLFTFKTQHGTSPAFSRVIALPLGSHISRGRRRNLAAPFARRTTMMTTIESFRTPRRVPCRSHKDAYSRAASLEDLLGTIVKAAAPLVLNLLGGQKNGAAKEGAPAAGANTDTAGALTSLLKTILASLAGGTPGAAVSQPHSLASNRFLDVQRGSLSHPFIFGIDDAILSTLIGPIVQVLPQLVNSATQQRVQLKQADNKLMSDLLSDVNRRMLLEQLVQAQRQAPAADQAGTPDLNKLIELLQQMPAQTQTPPLAGARSLSTRPASTVLSSSRAVLSFVTAPPIAWQGTERVLFAKGRPLRLSVRLNVAAPVPTSPLPKGILKIVFKDTSSQVVYCAKTLKLKSIDANAVMTCPVSADELARVPAGTPVTAFAELRWRNAKGREYSALGSADMALVDKYFLKEQGGEVSGEQELTDMTQFRAFWNKIWDAPILEQSNGQSDIGKKRLWDLEVDAKYSVLLSESDANGLMETKMLRAPGDDDTLTEQTRGRLKAGVELSVAELNKLLPLWATEMPLEADKLGAIRTSAMVRRNGGELVARLELKGRASQRGMVWVVPVFKLFELTLGTAEKTDEAGQVTVVGQETVHFPLPIAARIIGLKSDPSAEGEPATSSDETQSSNAAGSNGKRQPVYVFEGYEVEFNQKVMLTPPDVERNGKGRGNAYAG